MIFEHRWIHVFVWVSPAGIHLSLSLSTLISYSIELLLAEITWDFLEEEFEIQQSFVTGFFSGKRWGSMKRERKWWDSTAGSFDTGTSFCSSLKVAFSLTLCCAMQWSYFYSRLDFMPTFLLSSKGSSFLPTLLPLSPSFTLYTSFTLLFDSELAARSSKHILLNIWSYNVYFLLSPFFHHLLLVFISSPSLSHSFLPFSLTLIVPSLTFLFTYFFIPSSHT